MRNYANKPHNYAYRERSRLLKLHLPASLSSTANQIIKRHRLKITVWQALMLRLFLQAQLKKA